MEPIYMPLLGSARYPDQQMSLLGMLQLQEAQKKQEQGQQPNMNQMQNLLGNGSPITGASATSGSFGATGGATASGIPGGLTSGGASATSGSFGATGGATASGAGGGWGSALSSAGPWALLAAAIIGNEEEARKAGRRSDDKMTWGQDALTGKVLEQDMDYYGDKIGGFGGKFVSKMGQLGHPEGVFNFIKDLF